MATALLCATAAVCASFAPEQYAAYKTEFWWSLVVQFMFVAYFDLSIIKALQRYSKEG